MQTSSSSSSSASPNLHQVEHRGWKLQAQWLSSISTNIDGWVCYATRPHASQGLNLGRWSTSELALEHGRAHVDRQEDSKTAFSRKPHVAKRKQ